MAVKTKNQSTEQTAARESQVTHETKAGAPAKSPPTRAGRGPAVSDNLTGSAEPNIKVTRKGSFPDIDPVAQADGSPTSKTNQATDEKLIPAGAADASPPLENKKGGPHEPADFNEDRP